MIKAALGGGGKGMRTAHSPEEFENSFLTAQTEARNAFGDEAMYIEHFVENPRHIEFQILADHYGNVVHLGERDCSIQRHHQKLIEETPSPGISEKMREKMSQYAILAAKAVGYTNAGTIEFIVSPSGEFFFWVARRALSREHTKVSFSKEKRENFDKRYSILSAFVI